MSSKTDASNKTDIKANSKYCNQALMLSNRVKKRYKHFKKRYENNGIDIFRLYDWDIPEINAVVDWYSGHIVIGEYVRKNSDHSWLSLMAEAVAQTLCIEMDKVHIKQRHTGYQDGKRYERIAQIDKKIVISERDLKFYINLDDYVDTGLFSDHRNTRLMVREMVQGKDFLNLFCYTGSFSCYAAKGGARSTVSVDRSETAIQWAKENMELNGIQIEGNIKNQIQNESEYQKNILIKANAFDFLEKAKKKGQEFDIAVVDPPSFFNIKDSSLRNRIESAHTRRTEVNSNRINSSIKNLKHHFDIANDHPELLKAVIEVMRKNSDSVIFFSTNHQNFELNLNELGLIKSSCSKVDSSNSIKSNNDIKNNDIKNNDIKEIKEITAITISEDYKTPKKLIHRCWKITVG